MSLVLCDFDGTLTTRDTILPLGFFLRRANRTPVTHLAHVAAALFLLKLRVASNDHLKKEFCRRLLSGQTEEHVDRLSSEFAASYVTNILRDRMVRLLEQHRQKGDDVYLVSSNFDFVLRPLLERLSATDIIATEPEITNGRYTGRLARPACARAEKLTRVVARFGAERVRDAVAYGDSDDDRALLEFVKTPVWVS
jgi:phosphatidylglycerophosphatase C